MSVPTESEARERFRRSLLEADRFTVDGRFAGRTVIVTGAAGGIGSAIVRRAAREGATLMTTDRAEGGAEWVAGLVEGTDAEWCHVDADLSEESGAELLVHEAVERFGGIDVLVNNAGGGINRDFLTHTPQTRRETVDRNLWTVVNCMTAVLPLMQAAGYGRIVSVGADSVRNGLFQHAMYNAAKGGVHGITTGLAREFAPDGITVNTVAPTGTQTPFYFASPPEAVDRFAKNESLIPIGRFATTPEVASAVLYLASQEASFITGQVVSVNGGSTML